MTVKHRTCRSLDGQDAPFPVVAERAQATLISAANFCRHQLEFIGIMVSEAANVPIPSA
jgi:hypothetical protein